MTETVASTRKPFVAGAFYPAAAAELRASVAHYMGAANEAAQAGAPVPVPKAIIAPHAGYVYSGPIAASAYARILPAADRIRRVVLLGPSHCVGFRGVALPTVARFETALGPIELDTDAFAMVQGLPGVQFRDDAHAAEHSLEVHLPFLQTVLPSFKLVPIVVGDATPNEVAAVLDALWGGPETLIVISSDLSHYHDYATAQNIDTATTRAIEALAVDGISEQGACGRRPIRGLLEVARRRGLKARAIDVRNSGDTAGNKDRVVGYGSYVFEETTAPAPRASTLDATARALLHQVARDVVRKGASGALSGEPTVSLGRPMPILDTVRASFVTLNKGSLLRGCIGSLEARFPLVQDVARNAYKSAFADPRFPRVTADEVEGLEIKLSILSAPSPMSFGSEADLIAQLQPGVDGLILSDGGQRGTFLPSVWEQIPAAPDFFRRLKNKAGLPPDHWSPTVKVWRYSTESF